MAYTKRFLGMRLAVGAALGLIVAACANDRGPYPNLPRIGVGAEFTSRNLCGVGVSPEIQLGNLPANVATYRLQVTEISTLKGPRWQADLPAKGPLIAEGVLEGFDLPCPGDKQHLQYRVEVMALGADAQPLAYGWGFASARALPEQIEVEQKRAKPGERPSATGPRGSSRPYFFVQ
jgi:hypothetical protein